MEIVAKTRELTHFVINDRIYRDFLNTEETDLDKDNNKPIKSKLISMGLTMKGLRILLAFSFIATVIGFTTAYCEHRQYTELVGRYDTAIEKMSEYEELVAQLINSTTVSVYTTQYTEPPTTDETTEAPEVTKTTSDVDSAHNVSQSTQATSTKPQITTAQQTEKETTQKVNETSSTYYVTQSGKKYHIASCSYLSKSKIAISMDRIKAEGYTPCSRCIK